MTTITPGPWSAPVPYGNTRFEVQAHGRRIAVVDKIEDAHAIAALPNLIAALQAFIIETGGFPDSPGMRNADEQARDALRHAGAL